MYYDLRLTQSYPRKGTEKVSFQKKQQQLLLLQTIAIKQLKHIAAFTYNCSSSQTVEFNPLLRVSRDHSTLQP